MNAETKLVCLIGKPAKHSLSPVMHNAGYKTANLNYVYLAFEPENLKKTVDGFKEIGVSGFNVTMPFKEDIIKHLDRIDSTAKRIGAVNTVVNENGMLKGYNTDGLGAVEALKKVTQIKNKKILILGAGGAGKAITFYLKEEGADITLSDRTDLKAIKLAKYAGVNSVPLNQIKSLEEFDVLINASPCGMKPHINATPISPALLRRELVVFDIVYEPKETALLKEAKKRGCKTINGIEMLLEQGYIGFKLFTGKDAPKNEMNEAIMRELK